MRRFLQAFASAILVALAIPAFSAEPVQVRLIGINDFHGNLEGNQTLVLADPAAAGPDAPALRVPVGGAAALAGLVATLRAGAPHSLMVSAGDMIGASPLVSTLFRHESTIEVMNRIGVDVHVTGNHEFDAGFAELKRIAKGGCAKPVANSPAESCVDGPYPGAKFPIIVANVLGARGQPALPPYVVKTVGGVRIGIIGAVTRTTPTLVRPSGIAGLRFIDEADGINRAAAQLRKQGVRTIIAVLHEGGEVGPAENRADWNDPSCKERTGPIWDIAHRLTPEIRILFTGHTHQGYRCDFEGRLVIQGTLYGRGVSVVDVALDKRTGKLVPDSIRSINLPVLDARTPAELREKLAASLPAPYAQVLRDTRPDGEIAAQVDRYAKAVAPKANRPIGTIEGSFIRGGTTDSTAGRLIADAQLAATHGQGARIAFTNGSGVRANLECDSPPCTVTFGQAFAMQPFGNGLVLMSLTGAQIKAVLEAQQRRDTGEPFLLQPSRGFTYTWQSDAPRGERVRDMRLDGEPIRPDARYRVTVNNFLSEGGDGQPVLKDGREQTGAGEDLDALVAYLAAAPRKPDPTPRMKRLP